jgi:hypothetical protein
LKWRSFIATLPTYRTTTNLLKKEKPKRGLEQENDDNKQSDEKLDSIN